jgi:hypothetical protein
MGRQRPAAQNHRVAGGDLTLGDDAGGNLIQQWLEKVMGCAGDELDVDIDSLKFLSCGQAAEAGFDDDDLVRE